MDRHIAMWSKILNLLTTETDNWSAGVMILTETDRWSAGVMILNLFQLTGRCLSSYILTNQPHAKIVDVTDNWTASVTSVCVLLCKM
jgi:hypothetical protein